MDRSKPQNILLPSVLDRLSEDPAGSGSRLGIGVRELRAAVLRDLEWLLNTRKLLDKEREDELEEGRRSIIGYGLPDLTTYSRNSPTDIREICDYIKETIISFEPRLIPRTVTVEFRKSEEVDDFQLHFRVDGTLHVEPIVEPISFDTVLELGSGSIQIEGAE